MELVAGFGRRGVIEVEGRVEIGLGSGVCVRAGVGVGGAGRAKGGTYGVHVNGGDGGDVGGECAWKVGVVELVDGGVEAGVVGGDL